MTDGATVYIRENNEWVPWTGLSSVTVTASDVVTAATTAAAYACTYNPSTTTIYPYVPVTMDDFIKVGSGPGYDIYEDTYVPRGDEEIQESDMSIESLLGMG